MKKTSSSSNYKLAGAVALIIILGFAFVMFSSNSTSTPSSTATPSTDFASPTPKAEVEEGFNNRTFEQMNMSIDVPVGWEVEENDNFLFLTNDGAKIEIIQSFSNVSTLQEQLEISDSRRNPLIIEENDTLVNGYKAVERVEVIEQEIEETVFYLQPKEYSVYIFSTNNSESEKLLPQNVESFRYLE